jgi:nitrogen PTS system EIIA component
MSFEKGIDFDAVIDPALIEVNQSFKNKEEVLRHIASLAIKSDRLSNIREEYLLDRLLNRESVGSTGFGHGLAIPHCHLSEIDEFVVGCLTVPDGVDFNSQDGKPVRIIPFILSPMSSKRHHIRILSRLSIALATKDAVDEVLQCESAEAVRMTLLGYTEDQGRPQRTPKRSLIHIFLRDESLHNQVLEILVGVGVTSLQIIESRPAASYLSNLSLFAGLWSDGDEEYSKTIIALINSRLSNELIRRIERLTGPLEERNDIAICVQEVVFAGGQIALE